MIIGRDQYQLLAAAANGGLRETLQRKSSPEVVPPTPDSLPEANCSHALPPTDCLGVSPA